MAMDPRLMQQMANAPGSAADLSLALQQVGGPGQQQLDPQTQAALMAMLQQYGMQGQPQMQPGPPSGDGRFLDSIMAGLPLANPANTAAMPGMLGQLARYAAPVYRGSPAMAGMLGRGLMGANFATNAAEGLLGDAAGLASRLPAPAGALLGTAGRFLPGLGAAYYMARGKPLNALASLAPMIPGVGIPLLPLSILFNLLTGGD